MYSSNHTACNIDCNKGVRRRGIMKYLHLVTQRYQCVGPTYFLALDGGSCPVNIFARALINPPQVCIYFYF